MHTPDEIKKGLEYCVQLACPLEECPYYDAESCAQDKTYDALAYIQQLETERHQLLTKCERLERERDAAVADLSEVVTMLVLYGRDCNYCKHRKNRVCDNCHFEWRGVKEE